MAGEESGNGGELAVGKVEALAEPVAQGLDGHAVEEIEQVAALAEDAAQGTRHGKDELPVGHVMAEGMGNPVAGLAHPALVAGGAEVAALAGEGQQLLVAAIGALEAGESGGEVAAAVEFLDDVNGVGAKRPTGLAMGGSVVSEKLAPAVVDDLPEWRGAGAARAIDGGHKICS